MIRRMKPQCNSEGITGWLNNPKKLIYKLMVILDTDCLSLLERGSSAESDQLRAAMEVRDYGLAGANYN